MDAIVSLSAVVYLIALLVWLTGYRRKTETDEHEAWPLAAPREVEPELDEPWSVETHGWPPPGSRHWRLGGRIHSGGGDGMMSSGGGGGGGGDGGGGGGGGC